MSARAIPESVGSDGQVAVQLSTGEVLRGVLHASITFEDARELVSSTLDLEAAYKQLLVSKVSGWASDACVFNPVAAADELYLAAFRRAAAVFGFNRFARAIRKIGTRLFGLICGNYSNRRLPPAWFVGHGRSFLAEAFSFKGKLVFAEGKLFGRASSLFMPCLRERSLGREAIARLAPIFMPS